MDIMCINVVLRSVHCSSILSEVLHAGTGWDSARFWSSAYVGFQSHVHHSSWRSIRETDGADCRGDSCKILWILLPRVANGRVVGESGLVVRYVESLNFDFIEVTHNQCLSLNKYLVVRKEMFGFSAKSVWRRMTFKIGCHLDFGRSLNFWKLYFDFPDTQIIRMSIGHLMDSFCCFFCLLCSKFANSKMQINLFLKIND